MDKIEKLYAFIASDKEGEGIAAFYHDEHWYPMVGSNMERMESLRTVAQNISNQTGAIITLCEFEKRSEIEVIKPHE